MSLFVKEKLYIGESTVAVIFGLIVGPHCLNWFSPVSWGNSDSITLEISRVVLCLQIFAVAVELPKKYMLKHWLSVGILLLPVMTVGWLVIGLFIWILIPGLNFPESLLISACITATDPILAQSVVSGKFAQRVPGHLRNLLSAESGCNDGMAFPFIYLSLNMIIHPGNGREIVKDWICVTILYECLFGCIFGVLIGYGGRRAIRFAEEKKIIDRESFLAFYVVLALTCAGFGSILGVDDLLVSFAAGAAFAWDGWFSKRTEESKVSTVIDLLLNLAYFIYFGAIIPWEQFNNPEIGTNIWRLIILAVVVIFLRRIPAVLAIKPFIPDIKSWREAIFVGHFGPIGVGAIFAAILARSELEANATGEETPLRHLPEKGSKHWQLISCIWPIVCFFIVTSIIVHGSSVAVITLGRHLNTITLTKSFTAHTTNGNGRNSSWMQRLPALDKTGRSFSLHRIDTMAPSDTLSKHSTVETSGVPAKPIGGMKRKTAKKRRSKKKDLFRTKSWKSDGEEDQDAQLHKERLQREKEAQAAAFALSSSLRPTGEEDYEDYDESPDEDDDVDGREVEAVSIMDDKEAADAIANLDTVASNVPVTSKEDIEEQVFHKRKTGITPANTFNHEQIPFPAGGTTSSSNDYYDEKSDHDGRESQDSYGTEFEKKKHEMASKAEEEDAVAYAEGNRIIIENKQGEIIHQANLNREPKDEEENIGSGHSGNLSRTSSTKSTGLRKVLTPPHFRRQTLVDDEHGSKYFAYKIDNQLIIENEDGEVLRRYRINTHGDSNQSSEQRNRSPSVVAKALSAVGLGKVISNDKPEPKKKDTLQLPVNKRNEKKQKTLTPVPSSDGADLQYESNEDNYEGDGDYSENITDDNYSETDGSNVRNDRIEHEEDEQEQGEEKETAVERARRLTALGRVAAPRDEDDEEELPVPTARTGNQGPNTTDKVKNVIGRTFHVK